WLDGGVGSVGLVLVDIELWIRVLLLSMEKLYGGGRGGTPVGALLGNFTPSPPASPQHPPYPERLPGGTPAGTHTPKKLPQLIYPIYFSIFNPHIPQCAIFTI